MRRILALGYLAWMIPLSPSFAAQSFLVGDWFGQGEPNDKSEMWLARATADGKFHVEFRACIKGKAFDQVNDGTWVVKGATETVRYDTVNGHPVFPQDDVYTILSHDQNHQIYRFEPSGFVFASHRVAANFKMPGCDLTS